MKIVLEAIACDVVRSQSYGLVQGREKEVRLIVDGVVSL